MDHEGRRDPAAFELAQRAYAGAARLGDPHLMTEATFACSNSAPFVVWDSFVALFDRCTEDLQAAGAAHKHVSLMCAWAAYELLPAGRWGECEVRLRAALGSRPGPMGDALARLVGAELAGLRGRRAEAESHLARAEELFEETSGYRFFPFDLVRMRLAVAAGDKDSTLEAEVARARREPHEARAWAAAAAACAGVGKPHHEAYARWRLAQALLNDRSARSGAAAELRRAHATAVRLGAEPLLAEITALARTARITLDAVVTPVPAYGETGLTVRENEVLGHVVAGRTNAEIAAALVLSEKTVSVHVSNMLRKTGAANRIALARWARSR